MLKQVARGSLLLLLSCSVCLEVSAQATPPPVREAEAVWNIWGFESDEGFSTGWIEGQEGWYATSGTSTEPCVETANPFEGTQHLRIGGDPGFSQDEWVGAFSPVITDAGSDGGQVTFRLWWYPYSEGDFNVIVQAPSQGLVTAWLGYSLTGQIYVFTHNGTSWEFHDTGCLWVGGEYIDARINVDPATNDIWYSFGTCDYFTDVYAGTAIEQVVLRHDTYPSAYADIDSVEIDAGEVGEGDALIFASDFEIGSTVAWGDGLLFTPDSVDFYP